jgi:hypothetical protein
VERFRSLGASRGVRWEVTDCGSGVDWEGIRSVGSIHSSHMGGQQRRLAWSQGDTWVFSLKNKRGDPPYRCVPVDREQFGVSVSGDGLSFEPDRALRIPARREGMGKRRGGVVTGKGRIADVHVQVSAVNPGAWQAEQAPGRDLFDDYVDPPAGLWLLPHEFPLERLQVWSGG